MKRQLGDLLTDDRGDDLIEYALLCGLIGAIGVVAFPDIADKMSAAAQTFRMSSSRFERQFSRPDAARKSGGFAFARTPYRCRQQRRKS